MKSSLFLIFLAFPFLVLAEDSSTGSIDAGGGKSSVGTLTNHASIGSSFATGSVQAGASILNPGLVEVLYATPFIADKDGNGLPDDWENQYFPGITPVDPQADPDGDGTSNLMEYLAGTTPTDSSSHFKPQGDHNGVQHSIPIQTIVNRTYKVFVSKDMKNWYLDVTYTGDGAVKIYSFDETSIPSDDPLYHPTHPSKYFFRIELSETP